MRTQNYETQGVTLAPLGRSVLANCEKARIANCFVLFFQRTIIQTTFSRIHPLLDFSKGVVISTSANLQHFEQFLLLLEVLDKFGSSSSVLLSYNNYNTELLVYKPREHVIFRDIESNKNDQKNSEFRI